MLWNSLKEHMKNLITKAQVIMLPTENKSSIWSHKGRRLYYNQNNPNDVDDEIRYNIYIISDDEIKEGDYFLADNRLSQSSNSGKPNWIVCKCTQVKNTWKYCNEIPNEGHNGDWSKKIIATTDTSLKIFAGKGDICDLYYNLPQPSQQFIAKYIEEYNKGNIITDVLVELKSSDLHFFNADLRINPKDNTIIIKKLKDSWDREEMKKTLSKIVFDIEAPNKIEHIKEVQSFIDSWIEENL